MEDAELRIQALLFALIADGQPKKGSQAEKGESCSGCREERHHISKEIYTEKCSRHQTRRQGLNSATTLLLFISQHPTIPVVVVLI